ncbi:MAG: polysaccharide pyruvyl transferase family protein [Planctomycetota bacterium]|jgi:polysaccharide pyruvyl transferase WcaK-like protein
MTFTSDQPLRLCIFGAGPGTGNLGVSALGLSLLAGIARRVRNPLITTFDNGRGVRPARARVAGRDLNYQLCGAVPSRRIYRPDSLWRIRASGWVGGMGNDAIQAVRNADAVLDGTTGDSFTDLYSRRRFRVVTLEKTIALEQHRPLILLPQTIGPFLSARARRIARRIVRAATMVWARDQRSYRTLRDLLGRDFDTKRHRCGVDLGFGLEAQEPACRLPGRLDTWLAGGARRPLVGFNASGLIFNDAGGQARRFRLRADYRRAVIRFLERILHETDANILLVPHVLTTPGHFENDPDACAAVADTLGRIDAERVACLPGGFSPGETKWIIARTDWFSGTRMHAAIAALSSGVPTAAIAYSPKTLGVLESCGQGGHVADLRHVTTDDVVERLWRSWATRGATRADLEEGLSTVRSQVESQMDEIVACCAGSDVLRAPVACGPNMTTLRKAA